MNNMSLWYKQPAEKWKEALPLGNGRLGAMVYGAVDLENIQLNEDSLWQGDPVDRVNPDCLPNIDKIKSLILKGKIAEAEELALYAMSGIPQAQRAYVPFGNIYLKFNYRSEAQAMMMPLSHEAVSTTETEEYCRFLDLSEAIADVSYKIGDTKYSRTHFTSYPDNVLAIRLTAEGSKKLNFSCYLERFRNMDKVWKQDDCTIAYDGNTGKNGISFCGMLRASSADGSCEIIGEHLIVRDASKVLLLFSAATSFRCENWDKVCVDTLDHASALGYERLLQHHVDDYKSLFDRLKLSVHSNTENTIPTDKRLTSLADGAEDAPLMQLHFHYGRYLLIASSRPGSLPANLQGIWNNIYHFSLCDSKYTININLQMNYWAAEMGNLSECHLPLFDLLKRVQFTGTATARRMYNADGFVAHHNTDIYADSAPQDQCVSATYWLMGGAWLSVHLWNHYMYTRDMSFLKEYFYIIRDSVRFFNDYLMKNDDGYYVVVPTISPENTYIMEDGTTGRLCAGCAMDNQILTDLYSGYIEGCEILSLGNDDSVLEKAKNIYSGICPPVMK